MVFLNHFSLSPTAFCSCLFSDTCHFQKIQDDNSVSNSKTNDYDFHWNTSPSSIVCAFPYIIAFTSNTMEIRLLVNGNLVHTTTMDDLQLITSKRDIYFVTTAPEFIPKDFRIGCLENEQISSEANSRRPSRVNEFSNERILEIRHKIEKIEVQTKSDFDDEHVDSNIKSTINLSPEQQQAKLVSQSDSLECPMHINAEDNFSKFLPLPRTEHAQHMQRARSLQKPRDRSIIEDPKRLISKSNSYGDSYATSSHPCEKDFPMILNQSQEPAVPPNSPKVNSNNGLRSPSKNRHLKSPNNSPNSNGSSSDQSSADKCKPLRVFRIPLANLTGAHSHYHTHNSTPRINTKKQPRKIEEDDGLESSDMNIDGTRNGTTTTTTSETTILENSNCDSLESKNNLQTLTTNCMNLSLFSSI